MRRKSRAASPTTFCPNIETHTRHGERENNAIDNRDTAQNMNRLIVLVHNGAYLQLPNVFAVRWNWFQWDQCTVYPVQVYIRYVALSPCSIRLSHTQEQDRLTSDSVFHTFFFTFPWDYITTSFFSRYSPNITCETRAPAPGQCIAYALVLLCLAVSEMWKVGLHTMRTNVASDSINSIKNIINRFFDHSDFVSCQFAFSPSLFHKQQVDICLVHIFLVSSSFNFVCFGCVASGQYDGFLCQRIPIRLQFSLLLLLLPPFRATFFASWYRIFPCSFFLCLCRSLFYFRNTFVFASSIVVLVVRTERGVQNKKERPREAERERDPYT